MPGTNLTREEARTRARLLRVHTYDVTLELDPGAVPEGMGTTWFRSTSTVRFACGEPGAATFADLIAPEAVAVTLNGRALDVAEVFDGERIALTGLAGENELTVVAHCAYSRTGEGLHRFVDPVDGHVYLYTQFEPADARRVFADFEQPDLKAAFTVTVAAPSAWQVVGNAAAPRAVPHAERAGASVWRFAPTPRIPTYLAAVVAGPYHLVRDVHRVGETEIPLGVLCRASLAAHLDAADIFKVTKQGLDFYHGLFGYPYPWGTYDQAFVPEYNIGAMENPGCVTFREDFVHTSRMTDAAYERRANVMLHEMAHMWFGDLVTPQWWDDLWLKESFADFMAALTQAEATRWRHAWVTFANQRKAWAYRQDQWPTTHPVVADIRDLDDAKLNFDGITYAKGAAVLKQLMAYVGRDAFLDGARAYFERHAYGNTTLDDLLAALAESSGRDLDAWARVWLRTAGVTTLGARTELDDGGRVRSLTVTQDAAAIPGTAPHGTADGAAAADRPPAAPLLPHRVAVGLYTRTGAGLVRYRRAEVDVVGAETEVPELAGAERPELVVVNDDDLTYCKVRFDPASLATVREALGDITAALPRALCWSAVWNMTRDGELSAREYLDLVARFGGREPEVSVVQTLHQQARTALHFYVAPEHYAAAWRRLALASRELAETAVPGGDHQQLWVRFFAALAAEPEELALLRRLLEGSGEVPGLTVDQDMRWALLEPLVAHGAADGDDIDAELARDTTASGRRYALRCRAARTAAEAKQAAWEYLVGPDGLVSADGLPTATIEAVAEGFRHPSGRDLLTPFVEPYFAVIADIWRARSPENAMRLVSWLFPGLQVSAETLRRTDEWLAHAPDIPPLRRLVAEQRDELRRALRARQADAQA